MAADTFERIVVYYKGLRLGEGAKGQIDVLLVAREGDPRLPRIDKIGDWTALEDMRSLEGLGRWHGSFEYCEFIQHSIGAAPSKPPAILSTASALRISQRISLRRSASRSKPVLRASWNAFLVGPEQVAAAIDAMEALEESPPESTFRWRSSGDEGLEQGKCGHTLGGAARGGGR